MNHLFIALTASAFFADPANNEALRFIDDPDCDKPTTLCATRSFYDTVCIWRVFIDAADVFTRKRGRVTGEVFEKQLLW